MRRVRATVCLGAFALLIAAVPPASANHQYGAEHADLGVTAEVIASEGAERTVRHTVTNHGPAEAYAGEESDDFEVGIWLQFQISGATLLSTSIPCEDDPYVSGSNVDRVCGVGKSLAVGQSRSVDVRIRDDGDGRFFGGIRMNANYDQTVRSATVDPNYDNQTSNVTLGSREPNALIDAKNDARSIDYKPGKAAPVIVNVLANDEPSPGLEIDGIGGPAYGEAVAPGSGYIRYKPPSKRFVGTVTIPYTVRLPSDDVGTARDSAVLKLVYRACRTHRIDMHGVRLNRDQDEIRLNGRLRLCGDDKRITSEVMRQEKWESRQYRFFSLFAPLIEQASKALTRGAIGFRGTADWEGLAKKGSRSLKGDLRMCDQWTIVPGSAVPRKQVDRVVKRVRELLRARNAADRWIERILKRLTQLSFRVQCFSAIGYTSSLSSTSTSYTVKIATRHETLPNSPNAYIGIDGRIAERSVPKGRGTHFLECKLKRPSAVELTFGKCKAGQRRK